MKSDDEKALKDYSAYELKNIGPIKLIKAVRNSWKLLGEEQEAARQAKILEKDSKKNLIERIAEFYKTHKRSIVASFYVALISTALALNGKEIISAIKEEVNPNQNYVLDEKRPGIAYTRDEEGIVHIMDPKTCEEEGKECYDTMAELVNSQEEKAQPQQQEEEIQER